MKFKTTIVAICLSLAPASAQTITTFQVGAKSTIPYAINASGTVTGVYVDAQRHYHGFVRFPTGIVTTIDVPGSTETSVTGLNAAGVTVGSCLISGIAHGFMRDAKGNFTVFDPPGSSGTSAAAINPAGTITGYYYDSHEVTHGFFRTVDGAITSFDGPGPGTVANAINFAGVIVGLNNRQGFKRSAQGAESSFTPPDATTTSATGVNSSQEIAGLYYDQTGTVTHGFVRSKGAITIFDPPGSASTVVTGINDSATVVGVYSDGTTDHGFYRDAAGNITSFDVPGGTYTAAEAINKLG